MWILVNGYSKEVEQYPNVGGLVQPRNWAKAAPWVMAGRPWAVDNDYKRFDPANFLSMLRALRAAHADPSSSGCLFVAVPDVYADHEATLALLRKWHDLVWGFDLPLAFVVQNGATVKNVPWRDMRVLWRGGSSWYSGAIFIGGTTEWKFSEDAAAIVRVARRLGLWVHWGRETRSAELRMPRKSAATASTVADSANFASISRGERRQQPRSISRGCCEARGHLVQDVENRATVAERAVAAAQALPSAIAPIVAEIADPGTIRFHRVDAADSLAPLSNVRNGRMAVESAAAHIVAAKRLTTI